jgi:uncharacterized iron-regulated membrane protein
MKRLFLCIHRWLGLSSALFLLLIGLSGSLLVFRPELQSISLPSPATSQVISYQRLAEAVSVRYPTSRFNLRFVEQPRGVVLARVHTSGGERHLWLDASQAVVLSDEAADQGTFNWLFDLHQRLLLGEVGEWLSGGSGLLLALGCLSGLISWWPKRWRRIQLWRPGLGLRARVIILHRQIGACLALLLLISGLSGSLLVFSKPVHAWVNSWFGVRPETPHQVMGQGLTRLPLDLLVARAQQALPGGRLVDIRIDPRPDRPVLIRKRLAGEVHPNGRSMIELDTYRGTVLRAVAYPQATPAMKLNAWVYAWHIGAFGGLLHRAILLFCGVGLAFLCLTGVWQWLHRILRQSGAEGRV